MLPQLGHTEDFWAYEEAASTRLIKMYLDTGRVDTSLYTEEPSRSNAVVHALGPRRDRRRRPARLATLAVLSLLWLGGRLLRGKTFGRKGSVAARSLLPLILGLAGWLTGVLIVLIAFPTVPLTSEVLAGPGNRSVRLDVLAGAAAPVGEPEAPQATSIPGPA